MSSVSNEKSAGRSNEIYEELELFSYKSHSINNDALPNLKFKVLFVFVDDIAKPFKNYLISNLPNLNYTPIRIFNRNNGLFIGELLFTDEIAIMTSNESISSNSESYLLAFSDLLSGLIDCDSSVVVYDSVRIQNFMFEQSIEANRLRFMSNSTSNPYNKLKKLEIGNIVNSISSLTINLCRYRGINCHILVAIRETAINETCMLSYFQSIPLVEYLTLQKLEVPKIINLKQYMSNDKYLNNTEILYT